MMRCLLVALALSALAAPQTAPNARRSPAEVTVRLFSLHPPAEIQLAPDPEATWRACASCAPQPLRTATTLRARNGRVDVAGRGYARLQVAGRYRMGVADAAPLALAFPLAVAADGRSGTLKIVVRMPLEDYVTAVLVGESGGMRSDEALKAMAVAARSYAVRFRGRHVAFDFCDTTHCQDLRLAEAPERIRAAVAATGGELLWYRGAPAAAFYHRACGGMTEDATVLGREFAAPYLRSHQDPFCEAARREEWSSRISRAELGRALGLPHPADVTIVARAPSGRVARLRIGARETAAADFRLAVGRTMGWERLRSDFYEMRVEGDTLVFRGRGAGHGVGLCQLGADAMGAEGKSYREILAFYYPGTQVGITAQDLAWRALAEGQVVLLSGAPETDRFLLPLAARLLRGLRDTTSLELRRPVQLRVFSQTPAFRDATGEPGWMAASTRGDTIRLQPPAALQRQGALEVTLRHELLHVLLRQNAGQPPPLWFEEGLAQELGGGAASAGRCPAAPGALDRALAAPRSRAEMASAYAAAQACVHAAIVTHGKAAVLAWLKTGIPADIRSRAAAPAAH